MELFRVILASLALLLLGFLMLGQSADVSSPKAIPISLQQPTFADDEGSAVEFSPRYLDRNPLDQGGDECANAPILVLVLNNSLISTGSTDAFNVSCTVQCLNNSSSPDVFYSFMLDECRRIDMNLTGGDMFLAVYSDGQCCLPPPLLCNDDHASFTIPEWVDSSHIPAGSLDSYVAGELQAGTYSIRVGRYSTDSGPYTLTVWDNGACGMPSADTCLAAAYENEFRLGPVFLGETATAQVPFVNISHHNIQPVVGVDAPFLNVLSVNPPTVFPGDTFWVNVSYEGPALGWVDCALSLIEADCPPYWAPMTCESVPLPAIPGAPILSPGTDCATAAIRVDVNGNWSEVEYAIAASTDNFATTLYIQSDGTLAPSEAWMIVSQTPNFFEGDIHPISPGLTLSAKVKARREPYYTDFGPQSNLLIPPCLAPARPIGLTARRIADDLILNWQPVTTDSTGQYPLMDAKYVVYMAPELSGPYLPLDTVDSPVDTISLALIGLKQFFEVHTLSALGPLFSSLRITEPTAGTVLSGPFIIVAMDVGPMGVADGLDAVFQAKINGNWTEVSSLQAPQWIDGSAIWVTMIDSDSLPSGLCSLRVVEMTPLGEQFYAMQTMINRSPVPAIFSSFSPGIAYFDGLSSTDADGTIPYYSWTLPDGSHRYGPSIMLATGTQDTFILDLEVNDDRGTQTGETGGVACAAGNCEPKHRKCGCKEMVVNTDKKIEGKKKNFDKSAGLALDDGNPATKDDDQLLGEKHKDIPPQNDRTGKDKALAQFNFEMHATVFYKTANENEDCRHYQKFQLDEKCNGVRINVRDVWNHPIGGNTWADDKYDSKKDSHILNHDKGNPKADSSGGVIDWIDAPNRSKTLEELNDCGNLGYTYDCIFCAVVDGPLGCCRCKIRMTYTISKAGIVTSVPTIDKTDDAGDPNDDGLGCIKGPLGGCGC